MFLSAYITSAISTFWGHLSWQLKHEQHSHMASPEITSSFSPKSDSLMTSLGLKRGVTLATGQLLAQVPH
jgi:hypothetical protein